jgi:hypothetical protein
MMAFLGVDSLPVLSHMIRQTDKGKPISPSWVQVYRELVEWAILFAILKKDFGTDTLIVCDGLLRSKVFAKDLFQRLLQGMKDRINAQWSKSRRRVYLTGVAKHSKVAVPVPPGDGPGRGVPGRLPGLCGGAARGGREGLRLVGVRARRRPRRQRRL